jgi:ribose-phosphate pyrophosphokinase
MELIGDVEGRNVILVDDMIDTGGTLGEAADLMMERGIKRKSYLYACNIIGGLTKK